MNTIRVLLVEDHTLVRKGIRSILKSENDIEVIGEAEDGRKALEIVEQLNPDIVLMDISMSSLNGLQATQRIKKKLPKCKVIILTVHEVEEYIFPVLKAGASGYILKKSAPNELIMAIRAIYKGESFLSPSISKKVIKSYIQKGKVKESSSQFENLTEREREVLQLIAEGETNREIAEKLFISQKTVESHRYHLMEKLDMHTTADLVRYAIRRKIIRP